MNIDSVDNSNVQDNDSDQSYQISKILQEISSDDHHEHDQTMLPQSSSSSNILDDNRKLIWSMDAIRQMYQDYHVWPNFIGPKHVIFHEGKMNTNRSLIYLSSLLS